MNREMKRLEDTPGFCSDERKLWNKIKHQSKQIDRLMVSGDRISIAVVVRATCFPTATSRWQIVLSRENLLHCYSGS